MLVLKRYQNQVVEIQHRSGDILRVHLNGFAVSPFGSLSSLLGFVDPARNFEINRPDGRPRPPVEGYEEQASASLDSPA